MSLTIQQLTIIKEAAKGDEHAELFLRIFSERCHHVDDVLDIPGHASATELADREAEWLFCLANNPFWLAHKATLLPLMLCALGAWADSNVVGPDMVAPARDVLKGYWHEVVWMVAFIRGGWPHMRQLSARNRDFDFEPPGEPSTDVVRMEG